MTRLCWHFITIKNNVVKCAKRGVIRSWNCKLVNQRTTCLFYEPTNVDITNMNIQTVNLCEKCTHGYLAFSYGAKIYWCSRKGLKMYGKVSKCKFFEDANKQTVESKPKTLLDFFTK